MFESLLIKNRMEFGIPSFQEKDIVGIFGQHLISLQKGK